MWSTPLVPLRTDKRIDDIYLSAQIDEIEPQPANQDAYTGQDNLDIKIKFVEVKDQFDYQTPMSKAGSDTQSLALIKRNSTNLRSFKLKRQSTGREDGVDSQSQYGGGGVGAAVGTKSIKSVNKAGNSNSTVTAGIGVDSFIQGNKARALEAEPEDLAGKDLRIDELRKRIIKDAEIKAKLLKDRLKKRMNQGDFNDSEENALEQNDINNTTNNTNTKFNARNSQKGISGPVKVERLPKLIPQPLMANIQQAVDSQRQKTNHIVSKIKKNNTKMVDPYNMDDAKSFFKSQEYQFLTDNDHSHHAMKDLIKLRSGVTFVELSKSQNSLNSMKNLQINNTNNSTKSDYRPGATFVKEGPPSEDQPLNQSQSRGRMTLTQYKSMQGFAKFGTNLQGNIQSKNENLGVYQNSIENNYKGGQANIQIQDNQQQDISSIREDVYQNRANTALSGQYSIRAISRDKNAIFVHSKDPRSGLLSVTSQSRNTQRQIRDVTNSSSYDLQSGRPATCLMMGRADSALGGRKQPSSGVYGVSSNGGSQSGNRLRRNIP